VEKKTWKDIFGTNKAFLNALECAISSVPIDYTTKLNGVTIGDIANTGLLFLREAKGEEKRYRVHIPYITFKSMLEEVGASFTSVMDPLNQSDEAGVFEKVMIEWRRFIVAFYLLKERLMAKEEGRPERPIIKTLGALFPGALGRKAILEKKILLRELTSRDVPTKPIHQHNITAVVLQDHPLVSVNMLVDPYLLKNKDKAPSFDSGTVNQSADDPPPPQNKFFEGHQFKSHQTSDVPRLKNALRFLTAKTDSNNLWNEWFKVSDQYHIQFYNGLEYILVVVSNKPLLHYYKIKNTDVLPEKMVVVCNENFETYSFYLSQFLWNPAILGRYRKHHKTER
jgi:hypothetical protein